MTVSMVTTADFKNHPQIADGASELFATIFGEEKMSSRVVFGTFTLPVGVPVALEVIFEIGN